jgi:hypothetical protein
MTLQTWRFVPRRGTAAAWVTANPVLDNGEIGHETDTGLQKLGDGATAWNSLGYAGSKDGPRTGIYSLEMTKSSGSSWANQPFNNRHLFQLPVSATRMRVHIRNRDQLADADIAGTLTALSVFIGAPAVDGNGSPNGQFASTPTQLQSPTSLASGVELVTPWFTFPSDPKHTTQLLSVGWTTSASGGLAFSGGLCWQSLNLGDAGVLSPLGLARQNNAAFLQIWVEYEYSDNSAPRLLVVGNSLSNASHNGSPDNYGTLGSWSVLWGKSQEGIVANLSASGAWASHFGPTGNRWNVFDTCAVAYQPDALIYFALASSDTVGASVATSQANLIAAIQKGQSKFPSARHLVTNIPPRIEFNTPTLEAARATMNTWLHMLPAGTESCFDVDSLVTDWASYTPGLARLRPDYNADDTHFNCRGHQRVSEAVPFRRA